MAFKFGNFGGHFGSKQKTSGTQTFKDPSSRTPPTAPGIPDFNTSAFDTALGQLQQRAGGQNLISAQQAGLQQQRLQQTLAGSLGSGFDPAQARAALNATSQAGANIAGQAAVAAAQEQATAQQAIIQALLGQGQLAGQQFGQQLGFAGLNRQLSAGAEQGQLNRLQQQRLLTQQQQFDMQRRMMAAQLMAQAGRAQAALSGSQGTQQKSS